MSCFRYAEMALGNWYVNKRWSAHVAATVAAAHSWAKLEKPAKNEIQKIREIDGSYLCLLRFEKILNLKCMQWPETDVMWTVCEITSSKLIFGGFVPFWNHCADAWRTTTMHCMNHKFFRNENGVIIDANCSMKREIWLWKIVRMGPECTCSSM